MPICPEDSPLPRWLRSTDELILDPMAGGGVTPDTCLAMGRRCRAFDMIDQPDTRSEIEPFTWDISSDQGLLWPVSAKGKPDLIIFDPPYFDKKAADYDKKSISGLSKRAYIEFLEAFLALLKLNVKKTGWYHTHIIQAPMSTQRFNAGVVSAMQKRGILGVTSRYVIILNQQGLE